MGTRTVFIRFPARGVSAELPDRRLDACPVCGNPDLSIDYGTGSTLCREPICRAQWYDTYNRSIDFYSSPFYSSPPRVVSGAGGSITINGEIAFDDGDRVSGALADEIAKRARDMIRGRT